MKTLVADQIYKIAYPTGIPSIAEKGLMHKARNLTKSGKLPDDCHTFKQVAEKWHTVVDKLTQPSVLGSMIGEYTLQEGTSNIRFHVGIDWKPGDYGDSESCFFQSRSSARSIFNEYGGFAFQFLSEEGIGRGRVLGRVIPELDAMVLFNFYGTVEANMAKAQGRRDNKLMQAAGIVATLLEMDMKKIDLFVQKDLSTTMYINGDTGALIGDWNRIGPITAVTLPWSENVIPKCLVCGGPGTVDETTKVVLCSDHKTYFVHTCIHCAGTALFYREGDWEGLPKPDSIELVVPTRRNDRTAILHTTCLEKYGARKCCKCNRAFRTQDLIFLTGSKTWICPICLTYVQSDYQLQITCPSCYGSFFDENQRETWKRRDNKLVCAECAEAIDENRKINRKLRKPTQVEKVIANENQG